MCHVVCSALAPRAVIARSNLNLEIRCSPTTYKVGGVRSTFVQGRAYIIVHLKKKKKEKERKLWYKRLQASNEITLFASNELSAAESDEAKEIHYFPRVNFSVKLDRDNK